MAYTKNEGVYFAVLATLWVLLLARTGRWRSVLLFLLPILALYGPWVWWMRYVLDMGSHATAGIRMDVGMIAWLLSRIGPALHGISDIWLDVRQWSIVLWMVLPLGCWVLLWGSETARRAALLPWCLLGGYLLIILLHQAEIYWQVGTAWNRLTVQVLPLLLLVVAHAVFSRIHQQPVNRGLDRSHAAGP